MAHSHCSETKTILVVDDDIATRVLITDALREGGYPNTREVKNGFEALESFEREGSDLIISDLNMPGMSGMELLNRIKELNPSIPVIIVTRLSFHRQFRVGYEKRGCRLSHQTF